MHLYILSFLLFIFIKDTSPAKRTSEIEVISEFKDFKKILRTRTNVLCIFAHSSADLKKNDQIFQKVAFEARGKATIVYVNCGEAKKLCKKLKISIRDDVEYKHFREGKFNKDYDRPLTAKSLLNFLHDPTGEPPWDEEPDAADVVHLDSEKSLNKLIKKRQPTLVMFYAPWCGHCKRLKPEFAAAATELKPEHHILAGMDVDKPINMEVRIKYNITGFPTLFYFRDGKRLFNYGGENTKDGIVSWMKDPKPPEPPKQEVPWSEESKAIEHLTDTNFADFMESNPSVLVMFYAPWCGHCKAMKPEYEKAAVSLEEEASKYGSHVLAAVDATVHTATASKYEVKGYPTVKYFSDGKFKFDVNERKADGILSFLQSPSEPPPPPEPEPDWSSDPKNVIFPSSDEEFYATTRPMKHVLVVFYAPWCPHCKQIKPEFLEASTSFADDLTVAMVAVDCTKLNNLCTEFSISGYPTLKYFKFGNEESDYSGGRTAKDFVSFLKDPDAPPPEQPAPEPVDFWSEVTHGSDVHQLSDQNFDSFIKQHRMVLVMFYAPWCGHCRNMKPAFAEAAHSLMEVGSGARFAAVDGTAYQKLAKRFQVTGFPDIKLFKKSPKPVFNYSGARTVDGLVTFINSNSDSDTELGATEPKLPEAVDKPDVKQEL